VIWHPRFKSLSKIRPYERLSLFINHDLKANARLVQAMFYNEATEDPHIQAILGHFNTQLKWLYEEYQGRVSESMAYVDFTYSHLRLSLHSFCTMLSDIGALVDAQIVNRREDEESDEDEKQSKPGTLSSRVEQTTVILFPSSMITKSDNQNIVIKAASNIRGQTQTFTNLSFPFYRPVRRHFIVDKLTAFSFFLASMLKNDELFVISSASLADHSFNVDFSQFCELMGLLGIYYWKTVTSNEDLSVVEAISKLVLFMHGTIRGQLEDELQRKAKETTRQVLTQAWKQEKRIAGKQMLTKMCLPQRKFFSRRNSL
jgi:hypothetical protein